MNLGAGQPASLPYGVESQRWYSYQSMQFSSPLQQSPIPSVCYHQRLPGNYPPPHHFPQQNHYPPPLHFAQLNQYPPTPDPYSVYAYQPQFIPINQFVSPPHITHEPIHNPQLRSIPPHLDRVTNPNVPVVDLSPSSPQFSDARIDGFIESMSRLFDNCIAKCMKGIWVSEGSSPSVPTQTTKSQSSEPRVSSPLRLQSITKSSSPWGDVQTLSISRPRIKQACGEVISATGGVKKRRHWKSNKLLMRNKSLLKSSIVPSLLNNTALAHSNNISASSCFVSDTSITIPDVNFVDNGCDAIDFVFGDKLSGINVTCDNEKRRSYDMKVKMQNKDDCEFSKLEVDSMKEDEHGLDLNVKGREFGALHLLDEMSQSNGRVSVGRIVAAVLSIRDKGGGLDHKPLEFVAAVNYEEVNGVVKNSVKYGEQMETMVPYAMVKMGPFDTQIGGKLKATETPKTQGNILHSEGEFHEVLQKYILAKERLTENSVHIAFYVEDWDKAASEDYLLGIIWKKHKPKVTSHMQSEGTLAQWFILCLQLSYYVTKEIILFCKEALDGMRVMTQTSLSQVNQKQCSLLPYQHYWVASKRIVTPQGVISGLVEVKEGKIASIVKEEDRDGKTKLKNVIDYGEAVVMPGLIDVHAHLDDPGRSEWEGFPSGTKAAVAGGIPTLVDMPLNSFPSTASKETLELKLKAADSRIYVDVGFWGGLVPENAFNKSALEGFLNTGALGLKSFMCPSGINDFPMTNSSHIKEGLSVLEKYRRPLLVHAEKQPVSETKLGVEDASNDARSYSTYLKTRPPSWEEAAIKDLVTLAKDTRIGAPAEGVHLHIVHLSDSSSSLDLIKEAKSGGDSLTVETCPHYLAFSIEEIRDGDTRFKCSPPTRDAVNKEKLWKALLEGDLDMLSSDHSPTMPELKCLDDGDFLKTWGGISCLQFVLPVTWSYGLSLVDSILQDVCCFRYNDVAYMTGKVDTMADIDTSSGERYGEDSIAQWLYSGHQICPKTEQKLIYMALVPPNYALKNLLHQWYEGNNALESYSWDFVVTFGGKNVHSLTLGVKMVVLYFPICTYCPKHVEIYGESCFVGYVANQTYKLFHALIFDTSLGGNSDDEAGTPTRILIDKVQATQTWLFAAKAFLMITSLTLSALLITFTQVISTIVARIVQLDIAVFRYITDNLPTIGKASWLEIITAVCKDVEDLSSTTFAAESLFFYGNTATLSTISDYKPICKWMLSLYSTVVIEIVMCLKLEDKFGKRGMDCYDSRVIQSCGLHVTRK